MHTIFQIFSNSNFKGVIFPIAEAAKILCKHNAHPWFLLALKRWPHRPHIRKPSIWIAKNIKKDSVILETGCGCAWNLIWFGQNGYKNLYGMDLDQKVIFAGNDLCKMAKVNCKLWVDDSLTPAHVPEIKFDVILALNWTYHVSGFKLGNFLRTYNRYLKSDGKLVIDCVDSRYNDVLNNQYLTSDLKKPEKERAPSEYIHRFSKPFFIKIAEENGFKIKKIFKYSDQDLIPRTVYICQRQKKAAVAL